MPGAPQTAFENPPSPGYPVVKMYGSSSRSHYSNEGLPVVSGKIVSFVWKDKSDGKVLGRKNAISHMFPVGKFLVELTMKD